MSKINELGDTGLDEANPSVQKLFAMYGKEAGTKLVRSIQYRAKKASNILKQRISSLEHGEDLPRNKPVNK